MYAQAEDSKLSDWKKSAIIHGILSLIIKYIIMKNVTQSFITKIMRAAVLPAFLILLFSCSQNQSSKVEMAQEGPVQFKVAAYNVRVGRNATIKEIGESLRQYNLDIICFSEAPDGDWTKEVAEVLGMFFTQ